jgi:RNA polymerase sigma-70 factor (ECF subfamily)
MNQSKIPLQTDPESWVDDHGDALFRFALARVGKVDIAEELVQETFLSALRAADNFRGDSQGRTWLVSILKRKIIDYFRSKKRDSSSLLGQQDDSWLESLFDTRGQWKNAPQTWGTQPETALETEEFWGVFENCLNKIPKRMATTFRLRELDNYSAEDICKELQLSTSNLWVVLHRARMRLWKCLDLNWFNGEQRS